MLRIYFLQQWFGYSDPGMEEAFYERGASADHRIHHASAKTA